MKACALFGIHFNQTICRYDGAMGFEKTDPARMAEVLADDGSHSPMRYLLLPVMLNSANAYLTNSKFPRMREILRR